MFIKTYIFGIICGFLCTNIYATKNVYFGTKIGALSQLHHGVSGEVYAVDSRTLFLKNFNYDGEGPAAYFYVGTSRRPGNGQGTLRLRDETGSTGVIKRYRNKDITLSLPEGKTLRDVKWFSVWCDEFSVNFGDITIPKTLDFPRPHKINALSGVHGVSSDNIVIVDAQTLLIPNFSYDGEAPDAKFWVGHGTKPTSQGLRIPDENGKEIPLRRYDKRTIVLTLPGDLTVFDIGHFGVWCEAFTVDFGHVKIPDTVNVPPSLKMLGISPQSKLNCEVLYDDLAYEVRWAVAGESIVIQLVAKLDVREYMSFGISPDLSTTKMIGADVAVAWIEREFGKGFAIDYYLDDKSQCSGQRGSCPKSKLGGATPSIRLLNSAIVNGYSIITYQRPLKSNDSKLDVPILINGSQAIVWAIGPLNQRDEVSYHSQYTKGNRLIDFGRQPLWNCPFADSDRSSEEEEEDEVEEKEIGNRFSAPVEGNRRQTNEYLPTTSRRSVRKPATPQPAAKEGAWLIPPIQCYEPEDGVFYAQMGPTGGKHGYPAITGHVGWGISWYINGLLIPEINVVRGKTYTFVVEGGIDAEIPAKYHPFYITDDPIGGYEHKTDEERDQIKIYAGVKRTRNGDVIPTGVGRLCNWTPDPDGPPADEYDSFGAYQRSLSLKCEEGEPGVITWTPNEKTPDTVYYQCFTHRYLGWRINVLDSCDEDVAASEIDEVYVEPDKQDSFLAEPSIRYESKLKPNEPFLLAHDKDSKPLQYSNEYSNEQVDESQSKEDLEYESEISRIITDGIRAAEDLEKKIANQLASTTTTQKPKFNLGEIEESIPIVNSSPIRPENKTPYSRPVIIPSSVELPVYLRPPQNIPKGPVFHSAKLPARRPIKFERRPISRPQRPVILPQPSMIVNHYKKPVSPFVRPFVKNVPIKSIASVLLLGEPTEIPKSHQAINYQSQKPTFLNGPPQNLNNKQRHEVPILYSVKDKKPFGKPQLQSKVSSPSFYEYKPEGGQKNNGFQPDSVIVEGGFRPIIKRDETIEEELASVESNLNRRRDENLSDTEESNESDAVVLSRELQTRQFEPMFIPSPLDSVNNIKKIKRTKEHLTGDLADMDVEDGEDKMAVAAERQDTYYLPPDNRKIHEKKYPEGTVVAYDGKAVMDTSLVDSAPSDIVRENIYADVSKTETLIRNTPQFVPFRGEAPPLTPDYAPPHMIQFQPNRNLNAPLSPVNEYFNPYSNSNGKSNTARPISTKLTLVRADKDESTNRTKREAKPHHTPDHHGDSFDDVSDHGHQHTYTKSSSSSLQWYSNLMITLIFFRLFVLKL